MSLLLANIFGWFVAHKRILLIAVVLLAVLIAVLVISKSCNKPPKLDQQAIIKAQQAIETNDRKKMVDVLAESDVKEQSIDNSIKAAENATEAAKTSYQGKSNAELSAELERRLNQ